MTDTSAAYAAAIREAQAAASKPTRKRRAPRAIKLTIGKHDLARGGTACPTCRKKRARLWVRHVAFESGVPTSCVVQDTCARCRAADVLAVPLEETGYRLAAFQLARRAEQHENRARRMAQERRAKRGDGKPRTSARSGRTRAPRASVSKKNRSTPATRRAA